MGGVLSAFGNRVRRGDVPPPYGEALVTRSRSYLTRWVFVRTASEDIDAAIAMAAQFSLGLRLPDAIHIATAARLNATLISNDIRQVRAATTLGIAAINPLHIDGNRP